MCRTRWGTTPLAPAASFVTREQDGAAEAFCSLETGCQLARAPKRPKTLRARALVHTYKMADLVPHSVHRFQLVLDHPDIEVRGRYTSRIPITNVDLAVHLNAGQTSAQAVNACAKYLCARFAQAVGRSSGDLQSGWDLVHGEDDISLINLAGNILYHAQTSGGVPGGRPALVATYDLVTWDVTAGGATPLRVATAHFALRAKIMARARRNQGARGTTAAEDSRAFPPAVCGAWFVRSSTHANTRPHRSRMRPWPS